MYSANGFKMFTFTLKYVRCRRMHYYLFLSQVCFQTDLFALAYYKDEQDLDAALERSVSL